MSDHNEPPGHDPQEPEVPFDPYEGLMDLTGEEPLPPLEDPGLPPATAPRSPLLTGLILGLLLVVLSIAIFNLTRDDGTAAPATPVTTAPPSATTAAGDATATTDGSATSAAPTTTTEPAPVFDSYIAVGNPIPLSDLKLEVGGIGEIALGTDAADAVGRLIASLGDPSSDTGPVTATGEYGACIGKPARIVKFGALAAIVVIDEDGTETLGGYRLDLTYEEAASSAAAELQTLSGLKLGNSVLQMREIYPGFDITLVDDPDLGRIFELRSGNTNNLLLWGPVADTGNEGTDTIIGIYSVDASVGFC